MTYTLTNTSTVIRDSDKAYIPADPANTDWQTYQAWLSAPNTPNPVPVPPVVVPQSVSRLQFYQAAAQVGLITQAEAIAVIATGTIPPTLTAVVASLSASQQFAVQMAIIGSDYYQRSDALVSSLGLAMGQTSTQIDALFTLAASL